MWTEFKFWVKVKIASDCDIGDLLTPRQPVPQRMQMPGVRDLPQGHTKTAIMGRKQLVKADSFLFGGLLKHC